jgi:hypothetical protein
MYPHRLRLRGPWECEPLTSRDGNPPPAPRRFVPPARLSAAGLVDFAGRVRLTRRFGYPGRIDDCEHVWLTCTDVVGEAEVVLNGTQLGVRLTGAFEFEVTALLATRNRLEIVLDADTGDAGLAGEIALEVRRDAFLRDLAARRQLDGGIHVTGLVVGKSAMLLELYALADGRHVWYSTIAASGPGQPFEAAFVPETSPQQVRIDLVCVAECWYAAEVPVTGT